MTLFLAYNHLYLSGHAAYNPESDVFNNIIHAAAAFFIVNWFINLEKILWLGEFYRIIKTLCVPFKHMCGLGLNTTGC